MLNLYDSRSGVCRLNLGNACGAFDFILRSTGRWVRYDLSLQGRNDLLPIAVGPVTTVELAIIHDIAQYFFSAAED